MSENAEVQSEQQPAQTAEQPKPAAPAAQPEATKPQIRSIKDLLSKLEENERDAVLGELDEARKQAANYRARAREFGDDENYKRAKDALARLDEIEKEKQTAEEKALADAEAARKKADAATQRAIKSEVRALAATDFADPDDVAAFLDLSQYVSGEDIDTDAIKTDLKSLLEKKPYLGSKKRPADSLTQRPKDELTTGEASKGLESKSPSDLAEMIRKKTSRF